MQFLSSRNIIHCDLKPSNILLKNLSSENDFVINKSSALICDFGVTKQQLLSTEDTYKRGTIKYMPPEVLIDEVRKFKSDVWSLGCICYQLCFGMIPFDWMHNEAEVIKFYIRNNQATPLSALMENYINDSRITEILKNLPENFKDFMESCFKVDPNQRKSIEELSGLLQ